MRFLLPVAATALALVLLAGCGADDRGGDGSGMEFPEIIGAEATETGPGIYDIAVTISSPYDSPDRYADGWRVIGPGGDVLGEHVLTHDHASEQPFTRVQAAVGIPEGAETVSIEGHDLANGYGGDLFELELP